MTHRWFMMMVAAAGLILPAFALADEGVTVVGDINPDNARQFVWQITNNGRKPIVWFEASHYLGKLVDPPEGWAQTKLTANIGLGEKAAVGVVRCEAKTSSDAIRPGQKKAIGLRLDRRGGYCEPGEVTVGFADGSTAVLRGVLCPAKEPFLRNNYPVIGLGVMFGLFLLYKVARSRKPRESQSAAAT